MASEVDQGPPLIDEGAVSEEYLPKPPAKRRGIGLCLSGGGYRAALFHAGALRRLNEFGILSQVRTIASVSGGSIVAAIMADRIPWPAAPGPVPDWSALVWVPLRNMTRRNIRTPAIAKRLLLPWNWVRSSAAVESIAAAYERNITKRKLIDLPASPDFVLSATDMAFGVNWVFKRSRMGSYRPGYVTPPPSDLPLARAVAASSCFPPVFNPLPVGIEPDRYKKGMERKGPDRDQAIRGLRLSDGGVYDNMGIEPVWKDHAVVLVSDGGGLFDIEADKGLLKRLRRYTAIVENQALAVRRRWLIAGFETKVFEGTYWRISSARESYMKGDPLGYSKDLARKVIARVRTDLDYFSEAEAAVLENHGYLLADAAIQKHVPGLLPDPLPDLAVPNPDWMDEDRVRQALRKSGKRKLLGRWRLRLPWSR